MKSAITYPSDLWYTSEFRYIIAFSGAIGLLNLVPCFALDGQYILATLLDLHKPSNDFVESNQPQKRSFTYVVLMMIGTTLLSLNMILAVYSLFSSSYL